MLQTDRDRLKGLLKKHSLQFGDFTLASGRKSRYYFDSKRTTLLAEGAYLAAAEFLKCIRDNGIEADAVGGMTLGADPIVCPMAALSQIEGRPLSAFIVRKEAKGHGTARQIEGVLAPRSRVIVVDDVVTTGGSTLRAIEAVEAAGHEVAAVLCLVDREEGGTEPLSRWPFFPIFRRSEIPPLGDLRQRRRIDLDAPARTRSH
jgi:orotate phosphoribosyltransferase